MKKALKVLLEKNLLRFYWTRYPSSRKVNLLKIQIKVSSNRIVFKLSIRFRILTYLYIQLRFRWLQLIHTSPSFNRWTPKWWWTRLQWINLVSLTICPFTSLQSSPYMHFRICHRQESSRVTSLIRISYLKTSNSSSTWASSRWVKWCSRTLTFSHSSITSWSLIETYHI